MAMNRVSSNYLFQISAWIFGFLLLSIPLYFMMEDMKDCIDPQFPIGFWPGVISSVLSGIILGLILGTIDWMVERRIKSTTSFKRVFYLKSSLYILTFLIMVFTTSFLIRLSKTKSAELSIEGTMTQESYKIMTAYLIFTILYSLLVSFVNMTRRMFGDGKILPLFLGRYSDPQEEELIFMFLDLKGSTTIAERIGHLKFSRLLQDCFYDLNQLLEKYQARIYQYVGDEAIIIWPPKAGIKKENCLKIFYAYQDRLLQKKEAYQKAYDVFPEFKAGCHIGLVTLAEVGFVKKEIAYHGDVLNTTSRLQSICNDYQKNFLISERLKKMLPTNATFQYDSLGRMSLKGKVEELKVYSVEKNN